MKKNRLGKTGMEVSVVTFGGIVCTDEQPRDCERFVSYAIERGVNYFDVAPEYGNAQERLGPALAPYRKDVYLGCKSMLRGADAETELFDSLKLLHTDYFDLYMIHALITQDEVETIFGPGGAMEVLIRAKEAGYIRHIGITAHGETAAIQALAYYDFETVMFPVNWALNIDRGYGDKIINICKYRDLGLLAIKILAHRAFAGESEEKREPKAWVKTIYDNDEFALAALKYTLAKGVDTLIPPGNFGQFSFVVEHIDECLENPLTDSDRKYLEEELKLIEGRHIVDENGQYYGTFTKQY